MRCWVGSGCSWCFIPIRPQGRQAIVRILRAKQVEQVRLALGGVEAQRLKHGADLRAHVLGAIRVKDAASGPNQVEHREIWNTAPVGEAAPLEIRYSADGPAQLEDQTRLSHAGLPHDARNLS